MSDKTKFFSYAKAKRQTILVELKGYDPIEVRELSCAERDVFEVVVGETIKKNIRGIRALFIRHSAFWPGTEDHVFCDEDLEELNSCPASVVDPLFQAAAKLNGSQETLDELKKN